MNASVFKEDPCSILMGEELNTKAYKTAVAFVPSMRMKVWKPKEENTSSNTFCYMETNKFSYPTQDDCSVDKLFGEQVPFIKSTFFDNKLEKTKTFPENKCVFEIDKSKISDDGLNKFWTKINDLECTGQFVEYQKSNVTLASELKSLDSLIGNENKIKDQLKRDISSGNVLLNQYRIVYNNLQQNIGIVTTSNEELILKQDQVKAYIATIAADFQRFIKSYEASSNAVNNNIKNLNMRIDGQNKTLGSNLNQIAFIIKDIGYSNLRLTELKVAFSNEQIQYNELYDINKKLLVSLSAERGNLKGCTETLANHTNTMKWYEANVPIIKAEFDKNNTLNNVCTAASLQCYSNIEICLSNQYDLTGTNNTLIVKYQKLLDMYDICVGVQSNLVAQSNALSKAIKDWLATHYICDFQTNAMKSLNLQKETLQKTCRVSDKTAYDTTLMSAQAIVAQAAADRVTSCTADKNTLYTSVPLAPSSLSNPDSVVEEGLYDTHRVVTCPANYPAYIDEPNVCNTTESNFGQIMCDTYLPGKNAIFMNKKEPINGMRSAYYCSYMGNDFDEKIQNKEIMESGREPPIFLHMEYIHDAPLEIWRSGGRSGPVRFIVTKYEWLNSNGNASQYYSKAPEYHNNWGYVNKWDIGFLGNFKTLYGSFGFVKGSNISCFVNEKDPTMTCGNKMKSFNYQACSNVYGKGDNYGAIGLSCNSNDVMSALRPIKKEQEDGGIVHPYGHAICYGWNVDTQGGKCSGSFVGSLKIPSGHMFVWISDQNIDDADFEIAVGPCIYNIRDWCDRYIALRAITFNKSRWFFSDMTHEHLWEEIEEGKEYIIPTWTTSTCMGIPAWVNVQVKVINIKKIKDPTKIKWKYIEESTYLDSKTNSYIDASYINGAYNIQHFRKPGIYYAGSTGWTKSGTDWRFYSYKITRQVPSPTGWIPPFKKPSQ